MLNVPTDLAYQFASRMLSSTSTIAIYYYYSAQKLILILLFHGGWKAELKWGICAHTILVCPFTALTLLVECQAGNVAHKKLPLSIKITQHIFLREIKFLTGLEPLAYHSP